jgi:murein DD-endopeptidase MepM/ murein hydrolase activator NlpD
LHSNPTESNPLRGFRNPLGQPENPFPWTHWDGYGQKYAVDLGNTYIGAPVYAMRSGTVVEAYDGTPDKAPGRPIDDGKQGTTANLLIIKLDDSDGKDDGYRAMYLHLKQGSIPAQFKQKGARVNAGDKIGEVGYNGLANGVHLHVEVNLLNGNGQNKWDRRTIPFQWK